MKTTPKLSYLDIDEALEPMSSFVKDLVAVQEAFSNNEFGFSMEAESMEIDMPIEMDVLSNGQNEVILGGAPPTQQIETSFMPVFHQLKVTIVKE